MAVDMFIKLDGIKGESRDAKHKGEIDVLAWSWGLSNSGTMHMGGGGGAGKANVQDISFTKYVDAGSADLQLSCANGKHLKSAKLVVRKAGETPLEYIIIELGEMPGDFGLDRGLGRRGSPDGERHAQLRGGPLHVLDPGRQGREGRVQRVQVQHRRERQEVDDAARVPVVAAGDGRNAVLSALPPSGDPHAA